MGHALRPTTQYLFIRSAPTAARAARLCSIKHRAKAAAMGKLWGCWSSVAACILSGWGRTPKRDHQGDSYYSNLFFLVILCSIEGVAGRKVHESSGIGPLHIHGVEARSLSIAQWSNVCIGKAHNLMRFATASLTCNFNCKAGTPNDRSKENCQGLQQAWDRCYAIPSHAFRTVRCS